VLWQESPRRRAEFSLAGKPSLPVVALPSRICPRCVVGSSRATSTKYSQPPRSGKLDILNSGAGSNPMSWHCSASPRRRGYPVNLCSGLSALDPLAHLNLGLRPRLLSGTAFSALCADSNTVVGAEGPIHASLAQRARYQSNNARGRAFQRFRVLIRIRLSGPKARIHASLAQPRAKVSRVNNAPKEDRFPALCVLIRIRRCQGRRPDFMSPGATRQVSE